MRLEPIPFNKHKHATLRMRKAVPRAIYDFLARPYWRRLWIIQKVALAVRKSLVLCGESCVLLEDVYNALQIIQGDGAVLGRYVTSFAKGSGTSRRAWNHREDTYTVSEKLWERPIAMTEAQFQSEKASTQAASTGAFGALLISREALCSNERDRVYGILGLPGLDGIVSIFPDYACSPEYLFTRFSESLFNSGDLNGLSLVNNAIPEIGTWYFKPPYFSRPRAPKLVCKHREMEGFLKQGTCKMEEISLC